MKIKYATIVVDDTDKSIKFYTEVMGFKIDSQYDQEDDHIKVKEKP